jgi:transcription antitermination factor NusA-like protein
VRRLFELEVPEVYDGIVDIQGVEREPGFRAKIAVSSNDEKVDPVGACVGHRGSRVQAVVDELAGEKIDIVRYREDPKAFLGEALSPAEVSTVELDEKAKTAKVVVPEDQLSLAIGKKGQNVRLASRLTGWKIDVVGESEHEEKMQEALWASQDPADVRERVYDLAGELGITSKEAIDTLQAMGVDVASHASTVDGYTADDVRRAAKGEEATRYGPRPEGLAPTGDDEEPLPAEPEQVAPADVEEPLPAEPEQVAPADVEEPLPAEPEQVAPSDVEEPLPTEPEHAMRGDLEPLAQDEGAAPADDGDGQSASSAEPQDAESTSDEAPAEP